MISQIKKLAPSTPEGSIVNRRSFTLAELLITTVIFAILLMSASTMFVNLARGQKRQSVENYLATESRFLMERMVREVRKGTIDYEQYYRRKVVADPNEGYGGYFGSYGFNFFDPGIDDNTDYYNQYRYKCQPLLDPEPPCSDTNPINSDTLDKDTGKNPTTAADEVAQSKGNAFVLDAIPTKDDLKFSELYLIDSLGKNRTLIKFDSVAEEIKLLKLVGNDDDQDGIAENWTCHPDWLTILIRADTACQWKKPATIGGSPVSNTIDNPAFISITPTNIEVTALEFLIYPGEDPYKAFFEDKRLRAQPRVTIIMTLKATNSSGFTDINAPSVTLQTTVSSQVYYNIPSYNKFLRF